MALFKRKRGFERATAVFDQQSRAGVWTPLIKLLAVILVPLFLLWFFGQPAMLVEYNYTGPRSDPTMSNCHYLTVEGWKSAFPAHGRCPFLTTFPINIRNFLGV